jgi:hypothetical protein
VNALKREIIGVHDEADGAGLETGGSGRLEEKAVAMAKEKGLGSSLGP